MYQLKLRNLNGGNNYGVTIPYDLLEERGLLDDEDELTLDEILLTATWDERDGVFKVQIPEQSDIEPRSEVRAD